MSADLDTITLTIKNACALLDFALLRVMRREKKEEKTEEKGKN